MQYERLMKQLRHVSLDLGRIERRIEVNQERVHSLTEKMTGAKDEEINKLSVSINKAKESIDYDEQRWRKLLEEKNKYESNLRNI